jgi:uncharacterized membrane protein YhaH (DUF805 family)
MDHNPYQPPTSAATSHPSVHDQGLGWLLFSLQGRASRLQYWKGSLLQSALATGLVLFVFVPLSLLGAGSEVEPNEWALVALGLLGLPLFWMSFALCVKRFHDRNRSGWFTLIGLVPYLGFIWVLIDCGCLRGTVGPNGYGPDPLV